MDAIRARPAAALRRHHADRGDPSYVEVLVCLQMGRDAGQIDRSQAGGRQGN